MNDPEHLNELALRAREGDRRALGALVRALQAPLYRLCLRMLGDPADAEDATQEVLTKVITHLSAFEGRSALSTWAHTIAVRHVLAMRRGRAESAAMDEEAFAERLAMGLAFGATAPRAPDDLAMLAEVRLGCTQAMLLMLSRDERIALVLVDLLGLSGEDAAAVLEVSHAALRQRLGRARERLVGFLQAQCGLVAESAPCRCDRQLPAKIALGQRPDRLRLLPLSRGDLAPPSEVALASQELRAVRALSLAYGPDGVLDPPASLRARVEAMLPTLLREPDA
jgi:RNA polymerase sigma factor (sigma-70 family)